MPRRLLTPDMPSWLLELPKHALLNSSDILKIFPYSSVAALSNAMHEGRFPEPDEKLWRGRQSKMNNARYQGLCYAKEKDAHTGNFHFYWKAVTVRNEIRRRKRAQAK